MVRWLTELPEEGEIRAPPQLHMGISSLMYNATKKYKRGHSGFALREGPGLAERAGSRLLCSISGDLHSRVAPYCTRRQSWQYCGKGSVSRSKTERHTLT